MVRGRFSYGRRAIICGRIRHRRLEFDDATTTLQLALIRQR